MSVAHLAAVPPERLAGLVCLRGSALSHVAILARAIGIPAVMGLGDRADRPLRGLQTIIVDGYQGRIYIEPDPAVCEEYRQLIATEAELSAELNALRDQPAVTRDGHPLSLYARRRAVDRHRHRPRQRRRGHRPVPAPNPPSWCASRSQRGRAVPDLPANAGRPHAATGGHAHPGYRRRQDPALLLDREKNPFLGWRGMRFTLDHPEIFLTQLQRHAARQRRIQQFAHPVPDDHHVEEVEEALRPLARPIWNCGK
ncbi:MAG: hypothetical protein IPM89_00020 [Candidatus Competibacteraceae bacterium]|nr:MAG: hypothetical protein IPM89_00020 [Candidatus Competibacteraceae bacterium]